MAGEFDPADIDRVVRGFQPKAAPPAMLVATLKGDRVLVNATYLDGEREVSVRIPNPSDELRAALAATLAAAQADITERSTREQLTRYLSEEVAKLPRVQEETLRTRPG